MPKLNLLLLFLALGAVAFVGCDSADEGDDYDAILGRWEALGDPSEPDVYLNISDDEIVAHYFDDEEGTDAACYTRETFDVVDRDGDEWTLRYEDGETEVVLLRRDGDELVTESPEIEDGDIVRFERSSRTDFTPLCG